MPLPPSRIPLHYNTIYTTAHLSVEEVRSLTKSLQRLESRLDSFATPSSLSGQEAGFMLLRRLEDGGGILRFFGDGKPVISRGPSFPLSLHILKAESLVVQHLTPYLRKAVNAHRAERDLVLLNTERHFYLESSILGGYDKAPDMVVCHRAAVEEDKSDIDRNYDGVDKDYLFGKLANWNVRDMATCVIEMKIEINEKDNPWGEMVQYACRWASCIRNVKAPTAPKSGYMNWLLADAKLFYMIVSDASGIIVKAKSCCWDSPGGFELLGSFLCGGKLPDYGYHVSVSPWEIALDWCLESIGLILDCGSDSDRMAFLGLGCLGRVFRVKTKDGVSGALKIVVGESCVWKLRDEIERYERFRHKHLSTLKASDHHPRNLHAGLVSIPVGSKPKFNTKKVIIAATNTLVGKEGLFASNIVHGDARLPNLLYDKADDNYFWVDLHTVREVSEENRGDEESDISCFERDYCRIYGRRSDEKGDS